MILSLFTLSLLREDPKITFAAPVERADLAVAALGKAVGVPMQATGSVASEIVFLKVDGLSLPTAMASLAKVTCADWTRGEDGAYTLARSAERTVTEERREKNRELTALQAWRDEFVARLADPYDPDNLANVISEKARLDATPDGSATVAEQHKRSRHIEALERRDPIYRALARCLRELDLRPLTTLAPQACLVFSTDPNPMQRPMPGGIEAMRALLPEQVVWGAALRKMPS